MLGVRGKYRQITKKKRVVTSNIKALYDKNHVFFIDDVCINLI